MGVVVGAVVADVEVAVDDVGMLVVLVVLVAAELEEVVEEVREEVEEVGRAVAEVVEESGGSEDVVAGRVEVSPGGGRT